MIELCKIIRGNMTNQLESQYTSQIYGKLPPSNVKIVMICGNMIEEVSESTIDSEEELNVFSDSGCCPSSCLHTILYFLKFDDSMKQLL